MRTPKEEDNKQITHVINLCVMLVRVGNEFIQGTTAAGTQYPTANNTTAPKGN